MVWLVREHRVFVSLLAAIILLELTHGIEIVSVLPLYLTQSFHADETFVGLVASSYLLVDTLLIRTPAGWLADRWGRKRTLLAGVLFSGLAVLLMLLINQPDELIAANVVNGLGAGMVWPPIYALVADIYGRERRATVLGLVNMVMLGGIAAGGPIVGNVLLASLGYPDPRAFTRAFEVCLILVALAFVLVLFFAQDASHERRGPEPRALPAAGVSFSAGRSRGSFLLLLAIGLLIALGIGLLVPIITLFGLQVMRVTPFTFALVLIPPALTAALLLVPAGRWADRSGRELPLLLGVALIGAAFWGAPLSIDPLVVSLGGMAAGLGYALGVPAWNALVLDWIPSQSRGFFLGVVATVQGLGLALGPALGGLLYNTRGPYAPFTAAALLFTLATLLALYRFWSARHATLTHREPARG